MYLCQYILQYVHLHTTCTCISEFLICFEAWAKLAQRWLVCAPLGIHLEPINVNAVSDKYIHN